VNAPFAEAMRALPGRPAQREVDRRFVYIDPRPDRIGGVERNDPRPPSFFAMIFGSLSSIPREQPVRDNLEDLAHKSRETSRLRGIVAALQPEVEEAVAKLFGHTLFLDRPTVRRLTNWRNKAQQAAAERSGFAYQGYAQVKFAGIVDALARSIHAAAPELGLASADPIAEHLSRHLAEAGLGRIAGAAGRGVSDEAVEFFRVHDLGHRIRRLRLLARRLSEDWDDVDGVDDADREAARDAVYRALSLYFDREHPDSLGSDFPAAARGVFEDPTGVLDLIAERRQLPATDLVVDAILAEALAKMPEPLRRPVLLAYLGFPFYDTVTLTLLRGEPLNEFESVKVDRISPDDALSIRSGGTRETLRGVEFYNFGAFFSRAYRENDYLWGRLHGAERMIDLVASALPADEALSPERLQEFKRSAFLAILDEEETRLQVDPTLVPGIRAEVLAAS